MGGKTSKSAKTVKAVRQLSHANPTPEVCKSRQHEQDTKFKRNFLVNWMKLHVPVYDCHCMLSVIYFTHVNSYYIGKIAYSVIFKKKKKKKKKKTPGLYPRLKKKKKKKS